MTNLWYFSLVTILLVFSSIIVIAKPIILACDTYATTATCSRTSSEGGTDCDTCCARLLERMFDCPPCRYFVLNNRRQGSSCFCTVCFKQHRHRRRHQQPSSSPPPQNEQDLSSRFNF
jgi:hypothetical protein